MRVGVCGVCVCGACGVAVLLAALPFHAARLQATAAATLVAAPALGVALAASTTSYNVIKSYGVMCVYVQFSHLLQLLADKYS